MTSICSPLTLYDHALASGSLKLCFARSLRILYILCTTYGQQKQYCSYSAGRESVESSCSMMVLRLTNCGSLPNKDNMCKGSMRNCSLYLGSTRVFPKSRGGEEGENGERGGRGKRVGSGGGETRGQAAGEAPRSVMS